MCRYWQIKKYKTVIRISRNNNEWNWNGTVEEDWQPWSIVEIVSSEAFWVGAVVTVLSPSHVRVLQLNASVSYLISCSGRTLTRVWSILAADVWKRAELVCPVSRCEENVWLCVRVFPIVSTLMSDRWTEVTAEFNGTNNGRRAEGTVSSLHCRGQALRIVWFLFHFKAAWLKIKYQTWPDPRENLLLVNIVIQRFWYSSELKHTPPLTAAWCACRLVFSQRQVTLVLSVDVRVSSTGCV